MYVIAFFYFIKYLEALNSIVRLFITWLKELLSVLLFDMKNKKGSRSAIEIRHVKRLEREIIAAHKNVAINLISIKFNVKPTKMDREILCL